MQNDSSFNAMLRNLKRELLALKASKPAGCIIKNSIFYYVATDADEAQEAAYGARYRIEYADALPVITILVEGAEATFSTPVDGTQYCRIVVGNNSGKFTLISTRPIVNIIYDPQ